MYWLTVSRLLGSGSEGTDFSANLPRLSGCGCGYLAHEIRDITNVLGQGCTSSFKIGAQLGDPSVPVATV